MGSFANSLFKFLLGWLQGAVSAVWSAFTSQNGSAVFNWIGRYWLLIAGVLCVIGLAADLCVYLFRWKPFRVWKSFFSRDREEAAQEETSEPERPAEYRRTFSEPEEQPAAVVPRPVRARAEQRQEPDLSQWEPEPARPAKPAEQPAEKPSMVTNAGYVVPADSPYRRPVQREPETAGYAPEPPAAPQAEDRTERDAPVSVVPKRRRRISVSDLFSDPEEELREFDAPQNVIDSRRAYRQPVYPSGWKKSEEDGE